MGIPEHWQLVLLKEIVLAQKGKKPAQLKNKKFSGSVPYLDIETLEKGKIVKYAETFSSTISFENDILIVWDGSRSGLTMRGKKGAVGSTLMCISPILVNQEYLYYFLESNYEYFNNNTTGSSIPHLNQELFYNLPVPLPSLQEQERIVNRIKKDLDEYKQKLLDSEKDMLQELKEELGFENSKDIVSIEDFRQAVLEQGLNGKLTEDWREERKIKDNFLKDILKNVSFKITDGTHESPKTVNRGIPFITATNVYKEKIDFENCRYLPLEVHKKIYGRCNPEKGDILMVNIGSGTGNVALVEVDFEFSLKNVALIKPNFSKITGEYLKLYLSFIKNSILSKFLKGGAHPFLSLNSIERIPIVYPPLLEQKEIIQKVEKLLSKADEAEKDYHKTTQYISQLQKSVLQMAFQGELSEPQPDDEPVSVLLGRIKEEKEKLEKERKEQMKEVSKKRKVVKEKINEKKGIFEILNEAPHKKLEVDQVWQASKHYESWEKDGYEQFYKELQILIDDGKIKEKRFEDGMKIHLELVS